jgi:hypothetical protein
VWTFCGRASLPGDRLLYPCQGCGGISPSAAAFSAAASESATRYIGTPWLWAALQGVHPQIAVPAADVTDENGGDAAWIGGDQFAVQLGVLLAAVPDQEKRKGRVGVQQPADWFEFVAV